jgi:hypothetical protein
VTTPSVRSPRGSTFLLARRAGELARSTSAAQTARTMLGSRMYFSQSAEIFSFNVSGWSKEEICTYPGRSMRVRSGTFGLYIRRSIGSSETASEAGTARLRSVRVFWICEKSVILPRPREGNSPYSIACPFAPGGVWIRVSSIGAARDHVTPPHRTVRCEVEY